MKSVPLGLGLAAFLLTQAKASEVFVPPHRFYSLDLSGAVARDRSDGIASLAFQQRQPFSGRSLYWSWGTAYDHFAFENAPRFPVRQLQDFAFPLSLEYFHGSELAATISIKPGFYFENEVTWKAWDIPVEAFTGIPISQSLNGVIGIMAARFYHYPIPIIGVSWKIDDRWRLDGVYPEPALVYRASPALEAKLAGQLIGSGFRIESGVGGSKVEYSAYRIGLGFSYQTQASWRILADGGYQIDRKFAFFENSLTLHIPSGPYARFSWEFSS